MNLTESTPTTVYTAPQNSRTVIRVLLFASHLLVLESFSSFLDGTGEIEVAAGTTESEKLQKLAANNDFDVVVLCLLEDKADELENIVRLKEVCPDVRVVVLTGDSDIQSHQRAVEYGAAGIVRKEQEGKTLVRAIKQVHEGGTWFNQRLLSQILNRNGGNVAVKDWETTKIDYLTKRERQIIGVLTKGMNNKEISETLNISEATVRHHLSSIYSKLEIDDRLNLVIYAYQHNLVDAKDAK
jgi:two-component system, NarL family, response regulator DegU